MVRTGAAIGHPGHTVDAVAVSPRPRDPRSDQEIFAATAWVRVRHEGLWCVNRLRVSSAPPPEALTCHHDMPSHPRTGATRVDITRRAWSPASR